jgi:hypothetical protein
MNAQLWQRIRGLGKWRVTMIAGLVAVLCVSAFASAAVFTRALPAQARPVALGRYPVRAPKPDPKGAGAWFQQSRYGKTQPAPDTRAQD